MSCRLEWDPQLDRHAQWGLEALAHAGQCCGSREGDCKACELRGAVQAILLLRPVAAAAAAWLQKLISWTVVVQVQVAAVGQST